jgi:four helix bundle protein
VSDKRVHGVAVRLGRDRFHIRIHDVRDHRSLLAWQEARGVVLGVIGLARTGWKPYASALFAQLQRASLSVQLNIAEGYSYGESPTFRRHLSIAYGSAVETGELLEIALDAKIVGSQVANHLLSRNRRSQQLLLGMLRSKSARSRLS